MIIFASIEFETQMVLLVVVSLFLSLIFSFKRYEYVWSCYVSTSIVSLRKQEF